MPRHKTLPLILSGLALLALWAGASLFAYRAWIHGADHRDFYPRWAGARLALFEGRDLYAASTTRLIQTRLYGAPLPASADQQGFAYPAQLVVVLLPFWLIPNVEAATAVWVGFSASLIAGTLLLLRRVAGGPAHGMVAGGLLWYFTLIMLFQGQITALALAAVGVGYWAFCTRRDWTAGAVLALGLVKPELVLVPTLAVLGLALGQRRWRLLAGFALAGLVLFAASFAIAGWWVPGWLGAVREYAGYAKVIWPLGLAWRASPPLAVGPLAAALGGAYWLRHQPRLLVAASVPAGMLLLPQTLMWGLTMLLLPFALLWQGRTRWLIAALWLLGWLSLLGNLYSPQAWMAQAVGMPLLALVPVVYAAWRGRVVAAGAPASLATAETRASP